MTSDTVDTSRSSAGRDLLAIGFVVFGFYWLIRTVVSIVGQWHYLWIMRHSEFADRFVLPAYGIRVLALPGINLFLSLLIIAYSESIARLLVPREQDLTRAREFFHAAVKLIGVITIVMSLNQLYGGVMELMHVGESPLARGDTSLFGGFASRHQNWHNLVQPATALAIGIYLATGVRSWLHGD